jgi:hypothetical protein
LSWLMWVCKQLLSMIIWNVIAWVCLKLRWTEGVQFATARVRQLANAVDPKRW